MTNTVLEKDRTNTKNSKNSTTNKADHERFMRRAIELSKKAALEDCTGGAFGTVIVKDGQIIGEGINRWLRVAILRTVAPRRTEIAAFIRQVVENWDAETLVKRIELQVGPDLQYIRINGALVGGLVGLVIFSVARLFGAGS